MEERVDEHRRHPAQAEAADGDRRAIGHVLDRLACACDDLVHRAAHLVIAPIKSRPARQTTCGRWRCRARVVHRTCVALRRTTDMRRPVEWTTTSTRPRTGRGAVEPPGRLEDATPRGPAGGRGLRPRSRPSTRCRSRPRRAPCPRRSSRAARRRSGSPPRRPRCSRPSTPHRAQSSSFASHPPRRSPTGERRRPR